MTKKLCLLLLCSVLGNLAAAADEEDPQSSVTAAPAGGEEASLADVLEGASGVRVATMCTNCNVANVTMSGQTGSHVQVMADGLPVVGGLGAIYLLSVMPSEGVAATEIIRGAGTVLSGSEAAVGAVSLKLRNPQVNKAPLVSGTLDFGTLNWMGAKAIAAGRTGRWGGGIAATYSTTDGSDPNNDGYYDLGSARRTTYGGVGTVEVARGSYLRIDGLGYEEAQRDNKGGPISISTFHRENVDISRWEAGLGGDFTMPDRSRLLLRTRLARRAQDTEDNDAGVSQPYMTVKEDVKLGDLRYERTLWDRHLLTVGVDYKENQVAGISKKGPTSEDLAIDDTVSQDGAYAQIELALPVRFDLTVGLRYANIRMYGTQSGNLFSGLLDEDYDKTKVRFLPRLRLAWKANKILSLALSAGDSAMAPPPVFERVCCGATVVPNNLASAETARNYLLDVDLVPTRWAKIRASLFYHDYTDYLQKYALFANNYVPTFGNVNYTEFALEGAELAAEFRFLEHLSFGAQWTKVQVADDEPIELIVIDEPWPFVELPDGQIINLPEDQGSAFFKWDDPGTGAQVAVQAQYTSSMLNQLLPARGLGIVNEFWNTPAFWTFNLRFEGRIQKHVTLYGGVDNITNEVQTNLDNARYEYNWGPLRGRYLYMGARLEL